MTGKRDWWNKEFKVMMTLGKSTTAGGWSSCRERCWASQLARLINEFQRVPVQLVNLGIGANVISTRSGGYEHSGKPAATERLERQVLNYRTMEGLLLPDLLVIANDLGHRLVANKIFEVLASNCSALSLNTKEL